MDADLDTLCTVVYCTADDLLPEARANARRRITDAELVTLCVAQAIMGIPSDRRFLAAAQEATRATSSRSCPRRPATSGAGAGSPTRSSGSWRTSRSQSPGFADDLLLCDSTPVECGRSRETAKRSALGEAAGYGYCAAPLALVLGLSPAPAGRARRHPTSVHAGRSAARRARGRLELLERAVRGGEVLVADKGYAGRDFAADAGALGVLVVRPVRKDEPGRGPHLAPIRQRIESIFWTCKDLLTLERHGARTLAGLRERVLQRFLCLAACISLNHRLGRPSRALVDYCA